MENEIMNVMNEDNVTMEDMGIEGVGLGAGAAMLIGVGLAVAIGAGVKLGKKLYAVIKAKKELHKPDHEVEVDDEDIEEITK